mgnify:CR=1 FL=1
MIVVPEKQLKDHEGETVNQSQDHISAAAAQWIKDHDGNQVPADAVDAAKVVAKNQQDLMRTVPNQAKDEVNKKAAKAMPNYYAIVSNNVPPPSEFIDILV